MDRTVLAALALALCLAAAEVPREAAVVEECEALLHPERRASCYLDHAASLAEYYERSTAAGEAIYLSTALGLCDRLAQRGAQDALGRDACMRRVALAIGRRHVGEASDICTDIRSGAEQDGCLRGVAHLNVARDPVVAGAICQRVQSPSLRDPCLLSVASAVAAHDPRSSEPYCERLSDPGQRLGCLRRAREGDGACDAQLGERCDTHPRDCACGARALCEPSRRGSAQDGCVGVACGDGVCDAAEGQASCCADCGCPGPFVCRAGGCALRSLGEGCAEDAECERRHCAWGRCVILGDGLACAEDLECLSGYCGNGTCTPRVPRSEPCWRDEGCITRHCLSGACVAVPEGGRCGIDHECETYHCAGGACAALGVGAPCVDDVECRTGMCANMTCYGLQVGASCGSGRECESYVCESGLCAKREDGEPCERSEECKSKHCNRNICCYMGMDCCRSDAECPQGAECSASHFCTFLNEGEKELRTQGSLVTAMVFLIVAILIAVGGIKLAYAVSGAIVNQVLGRFDRELPYAMVCQKCGKRPATHGGLCSFCAIGTYHVDIEGRRLTERELRSLESAAPLGGFSPRRGAEAPIEGAVVAREGEGGGLFSYFRTRMTVGGGKGEGKDRPKG